MNESFGPSQSQKKLKPTRKAAREWKRKTETQWPEILDPIQKALTGKLRQLEDSLNQSINQSINQPINQSINLSISQSAFSRSNFIFWHPFEMRTIMNATKNHKVRQTLWLIRRLHFLNSQISIFKFNFFKLPIYIVLKKLMANHLNNKPNHIVIIVVKMYDTLHDTLRWRWSTNNFKMNL